MRYIIKQKLFAIGDKFKIQDESGQDMFYVKSKLLSFGNQLRIFDLSNKEVCFIKQRLFKFMPEYDIYINNQFVAKVKKKLKFLKNVFEIESSSGTYNVEGSIFAYEFNISNQGRHVASVSKKLFSIGDTYAVDIQENENQGLILAFTIVLDMIFHNNKSN